MKKACITFSVFAAAVFAALAVWGALAGGDTQDYEIYALYAALPLVSAVCCALITACYRFYGFIPAALSLACAAVLSLIALGGIRLLPCVAAAAGAVLGVGAGFLLRLAKNRARAGYRMLLLVSNLFITGVGTAYQCAVFVVVVALSSIGGAENAAAGIAATVPSLIIASVVIAAVNLCANAAVFLCFKSELSLTAKKLFLPALWAFAANLVFVAALVLLSAL